MTRNDLREAWNRIRHRRIDSFSPTPTEQAGALLFGQMLPLWAAIEVCDECGGSFWMDVKFVLEAVKRDEEDLARFVDSFRKVSR